MARVNAYGTDVPVGALRGLVRALRYQHGQEARAQSLARFEPAIRRAIPVMIALFIGVLAIMTWLQAREARSQAINSAIADMELIAAAIAPEINLQTSAAGSAPPVLSVPAHALAAGRQVIIAKGNGEILAKFPPNVDAPGTLADHLGPTQPLTTFAEKAGVMRIALADGREAIAHVHSLASPLGQVALIHPISAVLADWQAQTIRTFVGFASTAIVIAMLTSAFLWQAKRASSAEIGCDRVRDRIDTALSRGRCGLWDWDIARGRIYWSSSMYEVLGLEERGEFMSFGEVNRLIHPDDGDLTRMAEMLAASQANAIDYEFRVKHANQQWIWLRARAEMVRESLNEGAHLVGIAVDITDQKNQAQQTKTADMRLRDALETVSEALVLWDADNRLVMCNSKFQHLHRLPHDAVRPGAPYREVMANSTPLDVHTEVRLGETPQAGARTYEIALSDGRWLQINERRTKDGGYVSVGTDISKIKTHEVQLMDSERRLTGTVADLRRSRQTLELQAQQLADLAEKYLEQKAEAESANRAKSRFLANMSHELRTPLNAILGFADMMSQQVFGALGSQKYVDYCDHIQEGGRYLLDVISDVLEMSSLEAGRVHLKHEEFDIDAAVAKALEAVRPTSQAKNIRLVAEVTPGARLQADRPSVEKILAALLQNAVKFTPEGGRVTVRTRQIGGALNIYVEDNGIGMTPEAVRQLGHPFEQPGPVFENGMKGSGLGLSIARSLVELHHGTMRIRSTLGAGTIFLVHLPAPKKIGAITHQLPIAV